MGIDPTIREANIRDSLKKFFVDSLAINEGIQITFDKWLSTPKVQGAEVDKWVSILVGSIDLGTLSTIDVTIFCCTKMDSEGFKLAQLRDKVINYLIDTDMTDGMKRVILYRSSATEVWTNIGTMVVQIDSESPQTETNDGTKFKTIVCRFYWGAKC